MWQLIGWRGSHTAFKVVRSWVVLQLWSPCMSLVSRALNTVVVRCCATGLASAASALFMITIHFCKLHELVLCNAQAAAKHLRGWQNGNAWGWHICICQRDLWGFFLLPEFFPEAGFKTLLKNMLTLRHKHRLGKLVELCVIIRHMFQSLLGRTLVCEGLFLTLKGWQGHPALL